MIEFEDFKKPVNAISIGIGLLSLGLSIFFFLRSQRIPKPTYLVAQDSPKIFDSSLSSPAFRVVDRESTAIEQNIYLSTVSFWNAGQLPVEPGDVRRPIRIKLLGARRILDSAVAAATHPEIAGFRTVKDSPGLLSNEVELSWTHLDPGFGAKLRIIYAADAPATITVTGNVLGDDRFQDGRPLADRFKFLQGILIALGVAFKVLAEMFSEALTRKVSWRRFLAAATLTTLGSVLVYLAVFRGVTSPV